MNYSIHRYKRIASTNETALMLAEDGEPEGTVVIAESQSAGRGRLGKTWVSPDTGLYLSVILRPKIPVTYFWQMAYLVSVAAAESIHEMSGIDARIKWPNDILIDGNKVSGILLETFNGSDKQPWAIIAGVGINVNANEFPPEIAHSATSIAIAADKKFSVDNMESCFLSSLYKWYTRYTDDGFENVLNRWYQLNCSIGTEITVNTPDGIITGKAIRIDENGNMVIENKDGFIAVAVPEQIL